MKLLDLEDTGVSHCGDHLTDAASKEFIEGNYTHVKGVWDTVTFSPIKCKIISTNPPVVTIIDSEEE